MKVLLYSLKPEKFLKAVNSCGMQVTFDPSDNEVVAIVASNDATKHVLLVLDDDNIMPNTKLFIETAGGATDIALKSKFPQAQFFKELTELEDKLIKVKEEHFLLKKQKEANKIKTEKVKNLIISVYANKGGVGKTTVANSIAISLAEKGVNTVICDFDFGGANLAGFFKINKECKNYFMDLENIHQYLFKVKENLFLLPAPQDIVPSQIKGEQISILLDKLKENFSVVLCDTCPAPWEKHYMQNVFSVMDLVYAIVNQSKFSIDETKTYAPQLLFMGVNPENIRIIVNQYDPKLTNLKEIEKAFSAGFKKEVKKLPTIKGIIPHDWTEVNRATYKSEITNKDVWDKVCKEIIEQLSEQPVKSTAKKPKGLFSFFTRSD